MGLVVRKDVGVCSYELHIAGSDYCDWLFDFGTVVRICLPGSEETQARDFKTVPSILAFPDARGISAVHIEGGSLETPVLGISTCAVCRYSCRAGDYADERFPG